MRYAVVVNERSGSAIGRQSGELVQLVSEAFDAYGIAAEVSCVPPDGLKPALETARDTAPDAIVVGGGDGTVRCAAEVIAGSGIALGVIPLGTMNRLASDLGVPGDVRSAIDALACSTPVAIDVAEVNGRLFLCNSLMGLPLDFASRRQRLRGAGLVERITGYVGVVREMLSSTHRLSFTIDDQNRRRHARALSVAVLSNGFREGVPNPFLVRGRLDGGELAVYISRHASGRAMCAAILKAMVGLSPSDPDIDRIKATRVCLDFRRKRITVSNDGEIETLTAPLIYSIRPSALTVLKPVNATAERPGEVLRRAEEAIR